MKIRTHRTLVGALVILTAWALTAAVPRLSWAGADKGPQRVARAAAAVGQPQADRDFTQVEAGAVYTPGRLLVRFASTAQRDAALTALGGTLVEQVDLVPGLCIVSLAPGQTVAEALVAYNAAAGVVFAEPDYERTVNAVTPTFPEDEFFWFNPNYVAGQWSLYNPTVYTDYEYMSYYHDFGVAWTTTTAQVDFTRRVSDSASSYEIGLTLGRPENPDYLGQQGADVRAPEAWALTTGTRSVVIAVIDTGVSAGASDLAPNMWQNVNEQPGNGLDDDKNSYIDDYGGWNFVENIPDPSEVWIDAGKNLYYGHGTHVAGIIAAVGNNYLGMTGISWNSRLMPLRVFNSDGKGTVANEIKAIQYAVRMGADVINLSFNGSGFSASEMAAIQAVDGVTVTVVCAAGNNASNNDTSPRFPAGYPCKNIVTVMATDYFDNKASFSNLGPKTVDIGAPGIGILSVAAPYPAEDTLAPYLFHNLDPYSIWSGTSMAAAHVSGAAALLLSYNASMSPDNIRQALVWSAYRPAFYRNQGGVYAASAADAAAAPAPDDYVFQPLASTCVSQGRLDLYGALKNIVIQDVQESYFPPYMLEYQFGLRSVAGDGIADYLTTDTALGVQPYEDGFPISSTETNNFLTKAENKQFNCFVAMDYTGSMQADPATLAAMETGTVNFIDYMTSETGRTALIGLYEFHVEDESPRKVADFSTNPVFLDDKIQAGGRFAGINETIGAFYGGSRCWDAAYAAVNEFNRSGSVLTDEFRVVILFSDGRDESSVKKPADVIALARQLQVRVYVIGYGNELRFDSSFDIPEDEQPETVLKRIAFKTGARYYDSNEPGGIPQAYRRLVRDIQSFYVLRWATLKDSTKTTVPSFTVDMTPADELCLRHRASEYVGSNYVVANESGDRREGTLRWQVLESNDTTVTALIRATYVPRDIRFFDFFLPGGIDTADLVPYSAGLCGDWASDPSDPVTSGPIHLESPDAALPFACFGPILRVTVTARPGQTAKERAEALLRLVSVDNSGYADGQYFTLESFVLPPESPKAWTLLFYMNGDNAGEPQALADFLKLATIGTSDTVNVVVQLDRAAGTSAGYDNWTGTRRGRVFMGNMPDSTWGNDLGELDMGASATLRDFVTWGVQNFPAQRVGLVLWSRGADATSADTLEAAEVRLALADVLTTTSVKPDIVAFDDHLLGMAEVAYELRNSASLMVGSEASIVSAGLPYGDVLLDMTYTQVEPKDFGVSLVDKYALQATSTTLAVLDLTTMDTLADRVDRLAQTLEASWKTDFDACTAAATSVTLAVAQTVVHHRDGAAQIGSNGLAIYFPAASLGLDSAYDSAKYQFLSAVRWRAFLTDMATVVPGQSLIGQSWVATARAEARAYGGGVNVDLAGFCGRLLADVPNSPLPRDWTVLVYMDGDNDLETAALSDFTSMSLVGSDGNVNIVVMLDRAAGYDTRFTDWTDARRGLIRKDDTPTDSWGASVGEVNMGDPATLRDFLQWGVTSYPGTRYGLILWNHGKGWKGVCADAASASDLLKPAEIRSALDQAQTITGKSIDLIGFDASAMGMTEVAYELRGSGVMVASAAGVTTGALPYAALFSDLVSSPTMTAAAFGRRIAIDYLAVSGDSASMAVVDLGAMTTVGTQVDLLAQTLRLLAGTDHAACATAAENVKTALASAILYEGHGVLYTGSYGLSIYFPATLSAFDRTYNGLELSLPSQTQWEEFLADYYARLNRTWVLTARTTTFQYDTPENVDLYAFCDAVINNRQRDWTLLVYLDGDNKNEASAISNFIKMAAVGSDDNVNVVAMLDRSPAYDTSVGDWKGTRRGQIKVGDLPTASWGESVGSLDMGAPQTLSGFVEWGMTMFPATHYALVLWDSGNGWLLTAPSAAPAKSICVDGTSNDFLTLKEIRTALETVQTDFGATPEIVGLDASLMGMAETAYELRNVSRFLVASENRSLMPGWPYDTIVSTIESAPLATPQSVAASIASAAFEFQSATDTRATQSLIDLSRMGAVGTALDTFAVALNAHWEHEHDLVIAAVTDVQDAIDAAVLSDLHGSAISGTSGLSVYFPLTTAGVSSDYNAGELQLVADTHWDEFLANYEQQMADSWIDQVRTQMPALTDPLGATTANVDLADFCSRLASAQTGTISAKITYKNCTASMGYAAKGRRLIVSGATPASTVKIQRILAIPAGVPLVDGVGTGGPGILYVQCDGLAEIVASDSLGTLSSDRVPLGDVFVLGTLGTLSTRGCHADLSSAAAFRSVKMDEPATSVTVAIGANGLAVPARFKKATVNLVGASAGLVWLPGQQLALRTTSKRNTDSTGVNYVTQANVYTVYGGDLVSVTATGGDAVDKVVARGVLSNLSARGMIVTLYGTQRLFGGYLGLTDGNTTYTLTAAGGDAAWLDTHTRIETQPPVVIGTINGLRGVVVRALGGYAADTTGGTLTVEPNYRGAIGKIGTATYHGTGALTFGIHGDAYISQFAGDIGLSGDTAALSSGRLVIHRAP